jgi:uncharacterized protein YbcI
MAETQRRDSIMLAVSNAMVRLHKEQFGRGPTRSRSAFAGPDTLVCTLESVLVPAEEKLIELGHAERVRDTRTSFQAGTQADFIAAVEQLIFRKVRAFASAIDVKANVAYQIFTFERSGNGEGDSPRPGADAA